MKTNAAIRIPPAPSTATNAAASVDIRGVKPPVPIPAEWLWLGLLVGALALAAALYWAWRRWWKKKADTASAEPAMPPHLRAFQRLQQAMLSIHDARLFCILVSDIVRQYLEERFRLHAPERTTEEFLLELKSSLALHLEHKQILGDFLNRCDLVKFARYEPTQTELQAIHDLAVRLVEETQPPPPKPEASTDAPVPSAA